MTVSLLPQEATAEKLGQGQKLSQRELREYFEVRFRAEKYGVPYFLA